MVIVHGSAGVSPGEWEWANRLNALGIASFVIDNFTGRGVEETETDQFRLSPTADIAGVWRRFACSRPIPESTSSGSA